MGEGCDAHIPFLSKMPSPWDSPCGFTVHIACRHKQHVGAFPVCLPNELATIRQPNTPQSACCYGVALLHSP